MITSIQCWLMALLISVSGGALAQNRLNAPATRSQTIPKGEMLTFQYNQSRIFPGTSRTCRVYVPAQYNPRQPACLYAGLDGVLYNAPAVFDTLISRGEMPVTIGVFVDPGKLMSGDSVLLRYNRSNEFDNTTGDFARFLLEELLPWVEAQKTADGRLLRLSKRGSDHAIAGLSSSAIGAFTTAWFRPDAFSRVYSAIGTYVGMRGGDQYPVIVRKSEPKPIRIFLQDGSKDVWNPLFGNWYQANLTMEAALSFSGYDVAHAWGEGGHDSDQAGAIFPDVLRWLWKDWPEPVRAGKSGNNMLATLLLPQEDWKQVDTPVKLTGPLTATPVGEILITTDAGSIYKLSSDEEASLLVKTNLPIYALAGDANGTLYGSGKGPQGLWQYAGTGKVQPVGKELNGQAILVDDQNRKYLATPATHDDEMGKIWLIRPDGRQQLVDQRPFIGSALAFSPDKKLLFNSEKHANWIASYAVGPDGSLNNRQRWYWLHNLDNDTHRAIQSMAVDHLGNLYVATALGIQVCDQNGRVRAILSTPDGAVTALCFGGSDFDTLYMISGGKLYKRKLNVRGIPAWRKPVRYRSQGQG